MNNDLSDDAASKLSQLPGNWAGDVYLNGWREARRRAETKIHNLETEVANMRGLLNEWVIAWENGDFQPSKGIPYVDPRKILNATREALGGGK